MFPCWLSQCAMCKEAVETNGDPGLNLGIFLTIFLMIGMMFSLAGGLVWYVVRDSRKRAVESAPR